MDISEENIIDVNNTPTSSWDEVDNIATSDELNPQDQNTVYAEEHKGKKVFAISLFAISGAAILEGGSLLSSVISEPTLSNISIVNGDNSITLSLDISNKNNLTILASLFEDDLLKDETDFTKKGNNSFSYTFSNVDFSKKNVLQISFNNRIDYKKVIYEKEITVNAITNNFILWRCFI